MLAAILTLCGATTALAQTSYDYFYRSWDATNKVVNKEIRTCNSYTAINGSDSGWVGLYNGWYVVTGNSNYKTLNVLGDDVHLIIPDMVTLTLTGGVKLAAGKKLTIYSQGFYGHLTIYGGTVTGTGGSNGAGIGGGYYGNGASLTIWGGTVKATGSTKGAGIGPFANENLALFAPACYKTRKPLIAPIATSKGFLKMMMNSFRR